MDIVQGWTDLPAEPGVVLTIGVFDGVHLGHQALIRGVVERALELGCRPVVLTFHPHPRSVVAPDSNWGYLCSLEERLARIAELGPSLLIVLRFTSELAAMPAQAFVSEMLRRMPLRELHVGDDFALGRGKEGDVAVLQALGRCHGFAVRPAPTICVDGQAVRSTRIRELVQAGAVAEAARLLGRFFSLRGAVIAGRGVGNRLGFPTANLHLHARQVLPADGVYAVWGRLSSSFWEARLQPHLLHGAHPPLPGLAYVGRRPTFGPGQRQVEVHLLDFSADLLGHELRAEFVECLRHDQAFAGSAELAAQIGIDVGRARAILGGTNHFSLVPREP